MGNSNESAIQAASGALKNAAFALLPLPIFFAPSFYVREPVASTGAREKNGLGSDVSEDRLGTTIGPGTMNEQIG